MSVREEYFTNTVAIDFFRTVAGERLGSGVGREVWTCSLDPSVVIKFEIGSHSFQNVVEWETWESLRYHKPSAKWLVPCVKISPCGTVLIQKRTEPLRRSELPAKVPAWACDLKLENWGSFEGRPVMHDYGLSSVLMGRGATTAMKKADWG